MRWSELYAPTLRKPPAEAESANHDLLLRAGYVRPLMAGHWSLLPLGVRVRARIIAIIRAEMAAIGAQEFLLPTVHPADLWRRSGRWDAIGEEMFRLRDRRGADLGLGMTHEEVFTALAAELTSYRQLPQIWYQIQTKLRDEARPRSGLLRTREFTMKDSYSFDLDAEGLHASFEAHRLAYERIFARLGLRVVGVEASSGSMGGARSVEFACPAAIGEDTIVRCPRGDYAANQERATSALAPVADQAADLAPFDTPGVRTIADLTSGYGVAADRQIKTLVYLVDGALTLVLLRGDHALQEQKLIDCTGAASLRPAEPAEIRAALGADPGSLGAVGVTALPVLADEALRDRAGMVTGANTDDVHLRGVDVARDIAVRRWADLRAAAAGAPCPRCGAGLELSRAIEVGHIFQLGHRYSIPLGASVLGRDGTAVPLWMGSYGIGVERAMAAIVESHHDEHGIVWPRAVAPFDVVVTVAQSDDVEVAAAGARLHAALTARGLAVLLDDRAERAGVKFADAELIGIPHRVTVGRRDLAVGEVEWTRRVDAGSTRLPVAEAAEMLAAALKECAE